MLISARSLRERYNRHQDRICIMYTTIKYDGPYESLFSTSKENRLGWPWKLRTSLEVGNTGFRLSYPYSIKPARLRLACISARRVDCVFITISQNNNNIILLRFRLYEL